MDSFDADTNGNGNGKEESLPPPPPVVPSDVVPLKAEEVIPSPPEPVKKKITRLPIARRGLGSKGNKIPLLTNHFNVNIGNNDGFFFQYSVCPSNLMIWHFMYLCLCLISLLKLISFLLLVCNRCLLLMKTEALWKLRVSEGR
jgi:hypothetical protein